MLASAPTDEFTSEMYRYMRDLIGQRNYPCVAAVQSVAQSDFQIHRSHGFGTGADRQATRDVILSFIESWKKRRSTTFALWVAYPDCGALNEEQFEAAMWEELSALTSTSEADADWARGWSRDPSQRNFTLCIGGHAFFVVGLHPASSRKGRVFPFPVLIFNVFDQFRDLQAAGIYDAMVAKNRERDIKFSGSANPMAVEHGDTWESIQFSGRNNSGEWKCPFHFGMRTIEAQTGVAFCLRRGQVLTVRDPEGAQVADLFCFPADDLNDALSSGRTIDYNESMLISKGHLLYANSGRVLMTVLEDTCGRNDFLVTPCSAQMFQMIAGDRDLVHPSCLENLTTALSEFGVDPTRITTTFNVFMNVEFDSRGKIKVSTPTSKPGDRVVFRAEADLVVGLTACSDEGSNGGRCKPIQFSIDTPLSRFDSGL